MIRVEGVDMIDDIKQIYGFEQYPNDEGRLAIPSSSSSSSSSSGAVAIVSPASCRQTGIGSCCPPDVVIGSPEKCCNFTTESLIGCKLNLTYYQAGHPKSCRPHSCNNALFEIYLNGIYFGDANFNNAPDAGTRSFEVTISSTQATEITKVSFCKIILELKCKLPQCHTGIIWASLQLAEGKTITCDETIYDHTTPVIDQCIPGNGEVKLIFCPDQNCSPVCERKYKKIFSPTSLVSTVAGITSDNKLRFWGDKKYSRKLQDNCVCVDDFGQTSNNTINIKLRNDFCDYDSSYLTSGCPEVVCTGSSSSSISTPSSSSSAQCTKTYKHVSMTNNRIGLIDNNNKVSFIPDYAVTFSNDIGDHIQYPICGTGPNDVDCTASYSYVNVGNYTEDAFGGSICRIPRTLLIDMNGNVIYKARLDELDSSSIFYDKAFLDLNSQAWESYPSYYLKTDRTWCKNLYTLYRSQGIKAVQADFSDWYSVIRFENGKILIYRSNPEYFNAYIGDDSSSIAKIGVTWDNPSIEPQWKNQSYKFVSVMSSLVTAITNTGTIELYGHDINTSYFETFINEINATFNDIVKIIRVPYFVRNTSEVYCLRSNGQLIVFGEDNELTDIGIDDDIPNTTWERVIVDQATGFYYFRFSDPTIKFLDFTATGLENDWSIVGIQDLGDGSGIGTTACFAFKKYAEVEENERIGKFGAGKCCRNLVYQPSSSSSSVSSTSSSSSAQPVTCSSTTGGPSTTNVVSWGNPASDRTKVICGNYIDVSAGDAHTVALRSDGIVVCWGLDHEGSVNGIPAGLNGVTKVAAGSYHSMALRNGRVVCWGKNASGQCNVPLQAQSEVVQIEGGHIHSVALKSNGDVIQWGATTVEQPPSGLKAKKITAGRGWSAAITMQNTVVVWGKEPYSSYGEMEVPPELTNGANIVVDISGSRHHVLACTSQGIVYAWGAGINGGTNGSAQNYQQCMIPGGTSVLYGSYQDYVYGLSNVVKVYAGWKHSIAQRADGSLVFWGTNDNGVLTNPFGVNNPIKLSAGQTHNAAIIQ